MTREKAIKKVEAYLTAYLPIKQADEIDEILSALKAESCEDAVSLADVFEIMGNLLSIPYDFDRNITETDVKRLWMI